MRPLYASPAQQAPAQQTVSVGPTAEPTSTAPPQEDTMPPTYDSQQTYQSGSTSTPGGPYPSAPNNIPTGPGAIAVGPTTPSEGPPPAPETAPITISPPATGWAGWSTTKKAAVVGGGVLGLAAAIGIIKAIVR